MSDEENSGVFSRRKDYERRVPVATIPLPTWDQQDVYVINRNGTGLLRLTHGNYRLMISPHFYPGDKSVLFDTLHIDSNPWTLGSRMQGGLAHVSTNGSGQPIALKCATISSVTYGSPCFTPDGKQIVYGVNQNGTVGIYRAETDGSNPLPVKTGSIGTRFFDPRVSRDGKHIYYLERDDMSLWQMDMDGGHARRIAGGDLFSDPMTWKPETK